MLKNVQDLTSAGKQTGLNTQTNIIAIDKSQSPDMMDVKVEYDGSLSKRLGSNTQNSVIIANSAASGFSPSGNLTDSLISYWNLNEPSGTRNDLFGSNDLTDINSVAADGGIKGKAASFIANNTSYLTRLTNASLETGDIDFSISTWFYLLSTSTTVRRTIISKRDEAESSNIKLLLHMDGTDGSTTFTDSELIPKTVTANGNAQIDTAQSKFGGASGLFDGTGDYLSVPDSDDWDFGIGDFTIDFWVRFSSVTGRQDLVTRQTSADFLISKLATGNILVALEGVSLIDATWGPSIDTWYHVAVTRSGSSVRAFIDGVQSGATATGGTDIQGTGALLIGVDDTATGNFLNGWLDEFRIVKGQAEWTANFTPETVAYTNPIGPQQFEYWLYVNTDNILTFDVSSTGTGSEGRVRATSIGALDTATWYNAIAYHDTGNFLGLSVNLSVNSSAYSDGVRAGSAPLVMGAISNGTAYYGDLRVDETSFYKRVLASSDMTNIYNGGLANTYSEPFNTYPWASFDFGASDIRWLMVSAGTGVYASSNLGISWVTVATDRTANYQKFERSKNVLVATSDSYDPPLAWPGSSGTYMVQLCSNAPLCKYAINFQGFLVLLNSSTRKRGFFYQDENTQLTGTWSSSFDIPSSQDDEITESFILRRYLYVSTRYYLYRVSYVGGNPDFSYLKVKDWGFVQRTVKQLYVEGVGEVVAGLCWDGKMRFFDGSDDQIFSNNVEQDNSLCEFALKKISYSGSGPVVSFAEVNPNENTYKLVVAIGEDSSQTTHMLNYDGRAKAFYPYSNQFYNTMTMAESANRKFLMAFDRSGFCHMLDSGNLDGNRTPINEHFDSAFTFEKSPSQSHKGYRTDLFFSNKTCGTLQILDRTDFGTDYKLRHIFTIDGSERKAYIQVPLDIPESFNTYQWRLTSSAGTSDPWVLQRYDHFLKGQGIGQQ